MKKNKVLVIVGPTASGKTSLSIELAKKYNGEIISADSRQVYKGLDLGTGKVTKEEMRGIPHHLIDVADPKDTYTVSEYVKKAKKVVADIHERKKIPFLVGGTFLYIDVLLGKISTPEVPPNESLRTELESLETKELITRLETLDPQRLRTIDVHNRPRLVRAIEIATALGSVPETISEGRYDTLTLGIDISKEELHTNIHTRLITRIDAGMIDEVKRLYAEGLTYERMEELGLEYRYIAQYLQNKITYEKMLLEIETKSRQYAKRQMTWLKRNEKIIWVKKDEMERIKGLVEGFLT